MRILRGAVTRRTGLGLGLFALVGVVVSTSHVFASGNAADHARLLASASPQEVGQIALARAKTDFPVRSGTPRVVLSRTVTDAALPAMGLPSTNFASIEQPPLTLVILKGDFGFGEHAALSRTASSEHFQYIGYVFDLWAGEPALTIASPDGGVFRTALNDPTLPVVPAVAVAPLATPAARLHYGAVAPTLVPRLPGVHR
jgi:hypothetical protein